MIKNNRRPAGFSLIAAALSVTLILAFGLILINQVLSSRRTAKVLETSFTGTQLAEAGIIKAVYCLNADNGDNCGGHYGLNYTGETDVSLAGGKFTTAINGSGATRTVTATGTTGAGQSQAIATEVTTVPSANSSFSYALQAGDGGAYLSNNATIQGTIYTGGDVTCQSSNATIDGDAYSSKTGGQINSCHVNYYAHADEILSSYVVKDAYYQNDPADISGTTVKGAKHANSATPAAQVMPTTDLDGFHDAAQAGGTIIGNYAPADNSDLGPVKITGNLTLNNNVDVTLKGTVWVMGDITTSNNSSITLAATYGDASGVILADDPGDRPGKGKVYIENGTDIYGSGNPKSHILIATTNSSSSDSSPAMTIKNNANGAIFYALNGTLRLYNNAGAKALAGKRLYLDQNATVTYLQSEMSNAYFSNSPGGTWRVKGGTWRETR